MVAAPVGDLSGIGAGALSTTGWNGVGAPPVAPATRNANHPESLVIAIVRLGAGGERPADGPLERGSYPQLPGGQTARARRPAWFYPGSIASWFHPGIIRG